VPSSQNRSHCTITVPGSQGAARNVLDVRPEHEVAVTLRPGEISYPETVFISTSTASR
jgi:hypothetical protein